MNRKTRNSFFKIHTWLGLHLSLFFTFMFLTGTLLTVGIELESITRPNIWTTVPSEDRTAGFGDIYAGIKEARPDAKIGLISIDTKPWFVNRSFGSTAWGESVSFWTDPVTSALVEETRAVGFRNILRDLHDSFLTTNRLVFVVVSAMSLVLLLQIISGLITYRRFWKGFFRWPTRSNGQRSWIGGLHRLSALWALPLSLLIAVTGVYFMLGGLGLKGSSPSPQPPAVRETALPAGFDRSVIDTAEEHARNALPGFDPTVMSLPGRKNKGINFIGHQTGFSEFSGLSTVTIDPVTFEVLGAFSPADDRGLKRVKVLMNKLHFGTWGGAFSLGLWVVLGLVATGVALTGALIFAARIAPDSASGGAFRRIWRGLGLARWAYLILLLLIGASAYLHYGPGSHGRVAVHPVDQQGNVARLVLTRPLRRDTPLEIELDIRAPEIATAELQINQGDFAPLALNRNGDKSRAMFTLNPDDAGNKILARLYSADGAEQIVTFRLGQPIW